MKSRINFTEEFELTLRLDCGAQHVIMDDSVSLASCLWQKLNFLRKTFLKRSLESFTFGLG